MITYKSDNEIKLLQEGGHILAKILKRLLSELKPGVSTEQLENIACKLMAEAGGKPAFKGYRSYPGAKPYPTALCISFNDEVVHAPALPSRIVKAGDVVSIDIGMEYKGFFTDMAATQAVGKVDKNITKLLAVTKKSLEVAIKKVKPGATVYDLGKAVEDCIDREGFSVVRDLVGHGVGYGVHEDPQIPNFAMDDMKRVVLAPGMVIAIEPMVNLGKHHIYTGPDGLTIKTADGSISAHFEHTIAVTKTGHLVLTK